MKTCRKCGVSKQDREFFGDKKSRDGLQAWCKPCKSISVKASPSYKNKARRTPEQARARYEANKVSFNISRRMRASLMSGRKPHWESIVGFTLSDLKSHLEKNFLDGMTWENYGDWHIDHIKPLASFGPLSASSDSFLKAWALENLQPLWAMDNMSKGARIL